VRKDISGLLVHIDLDATELKFGVLKDNQSRCVVSCHGCLETHDSKIILLKSHISKREFYYCSSCLGKMSWTEEKKKKIKDYWSVPENILKEHEIRKDKWKNGKYRSQMENIIQERSATPAFKNKMSVLSLKKWEDPSYHLNISDQIKNKWEDPEYRNKQEAYKTDEWKSEHSKTQTLLWTDESYKQNISRKISEAWNDDEYRNNQVIKQTQVWLNPDHKEKQSRMMKEKWKDPSFRAKYENLWKSKSWRKNLSDTLKKICSNPEYKAKLSETSKSRWGNPEYREKVSKGVSRAWDDPDYRQNKAESAKAFWDNEDNRQKFALIRAAQSGRRSNIEKIVSEILKGLNINFEEQKALGVYVFDFYLNEYDLYIECQGEYWHSLPGRKERDAAKYTYLEKAAPKSRILYLYEHEFINPNTILSKLMNATIPQNMPGNDFIESFRFQDLLIKTVEREEGASFLNAFHYAANGRAGKSIYGVYLGSVLIAVAKFSSVIRQESASSLGLHPKNVCELDRFCIHPRYHKRNFASWVLSRVTKMVLSDTRINYIISFADSTYGHNGTIYKAANWGYVSNVKADYYYVNEEGFILHKKTLYNRAVKMKCTEKQYAETHNYMKCWGREKFKFIYPRIVKTLS